MGPFILAVAGFAIIGMLDFLFYLVDLSVLSGVSSHVLLKLLFYKLPGIMVLFFPMAVLFSVMLMLVRMAKDSELTALRTSGVHTLRILTPLLVACFFVAGMSYLSNEKLVPWTAQASETVMREHIQHIPPPEIVQNVVFKEGDRFFYIQEVDAKHNELKHLLMFEERAHFPRLTTAQKAVWKGRSWHLQKGYIQDINDDGSMRFSDHFSELILHVDQDLAAFYRPPKSAREMDSKELRNKIQGLQKSGLSTRSLSVEYHMKKSVPVACVIFGLIGMSYCLTFVRSGQDWWGVIIAICLAVLTVALYFFMVALCRAFAKSGTLDPLLGAWLPNVVYGTLGLSLVSYQSVMK